MLHNVIRSSLKEFATKIQHEDVVTEPSDDVNEVLDHDDRGLPMVSDPLLDFAYLFNFEACETAHDLVEQHQLGFRRKHARKLELLLRAQSQRPGQNVRLIRQTNEP